MPKYISIARDIQERIQQHEFINSKLPTEDKLMKEYDVSRNTIRNAIQLLSNQGVIYPVQGSGMFIRNTQKEGTILLRKTRGITSDNLEHNIKTKVYDFQLLEADEKIAEMMRCDLKTPVYFIKRLRYVDGNPFALEYTYYNKDYIRFLNREIAESSIFNYIKDDLNLNIGFADKYITAEKLTDEDAQILELNAGDPGLIIQDNIYLNNGKLFNASKIIYNYQHTNFFVVTE